MNEYKVEFNGVEGSYSADYFTNNYKELIERVENVLKELGGGHADIYNGYDGEFIEDVEI